METVAFPTEVFKEAVRLLLHTSDFHLMLLTFGASYVVIISILELVRRIREARE